MKLRALEILEGPARNSAVDIFRFFAVTGVVLFHFNYTVPFGDIGVDLFFVISGLLVGGLLTRDFAGGKPIHFLRFFLQRGFKIWPSYYFFLIAGTLFTWLLYSETHPEQIISGWHDARRYVFFYQNYTGRPFHPGFDHAWSLCVEEHFYILLPLLFIVLSFIKKAESRIKMLYASVIFVIGAGIVFKFLSYWLTNSKDTTMGTHNRLDALAWGVLLNLLTLRHESSLRIPLVRAFAFFAGGTLLVLAVLYRHSEQSVLFNKLCYHSVVPFAFFLLLLSCYYINFSMFKGLRFMSYYSYNWYLWHPPCVIIISEWLGTSVAGILSYLILSFGLAFISTLIIEEPFLKKREKVLKKIFGEKQAAPESA
jgi:peptidoglycan/LPS O-acetylase OafA/YrhL